tara:strand:+ start:550 stop:714 length:165 start_codon:yes stop_codon:yes gene_type:complete
MTGQEDLIHPPGPKRGENMEEAIKDLSIEELLQIVKLAQKEIDRRTIKIVDKNA